jgi:hypothetical protein
MASTVLAQKDQAQKIIYTLSGEKYFGRGYVKKGDYKAAQFIRKQFQQYGLQPLSGSWLQKFQHPVNRFNGDVYVKIDQQVYRAGYDYLVHPQSAASHRKFPIAMADSTDLLGRLAAGSDSCFVVSRSSFDALRKELMPLLFQIQKGAIIILENKKLTWGVGTSAFGIPVVELYDTLFNRQSQQVTLIIDASFNANYQSNNVVGFLPGKVKPDSLIVITAHYDHLGGMGKNTYFPGANDNASGVAMLLSLAQYYAIQKNNRYSILFIAFAAEEAGLKGSEYFVEHPMVSLSHIRFLINLDLLGTGDDGIMVVNATEFPNDFEMLKSINDEKKFVKQIGQRGKARNSDHYYFSEKGVPSFFIYTLGGVTWYHDVLDRAETLPLTRFDEVFNLLTAFIHQLQ